jgi:predicted component of viral defense system (DUF524 family)
VLLGRLEVVNPRCTPETFDALLADLSARSAALPFRRGGGSALPYERAVTDEPDLDWHAFTYLRHALSDRAPPQEHLRSALALVIAEPHRRWRTTEEVVPTPEATDIDPGVLLDLATGAAPSTRVPARRFTLGDRLRGRMPTEVRARRPIDTLDTPENRFVLDLLQQCSRLLDRVATASAAGSVHADVADLRTRLAPALGADLWTAVGRLDRIPVTSTVLQGRRGYREVFRVSERLRLASRSPLQPSILHDLLENRDIATLYELWVYFAVVAAVEAVLGRPTHADRVEVHATDKRVRWGHRVAWADVSVSYNECFSIGNGGSWSLPLRPDVVLSVGAVRHVFDAKFKVDWLGGALADDAIDAEERRGVYHRGDVYKMHAYRDALPAVATAWVVYPGTESQAWHAADGSVGVVPAVPGAEEALRARVARLLAGAV